MSYTFDSRLYNWVWGTYCCRVWSESCTYDSVSGPPPTSCEARLMLRTLSNKLVDPAAAPVFGYRLGDTVVVNLRLEFCWRSSPGFWGLAAAVLEHSQNHTSFMEAMPIPGGKETSTNISIA